MVVGGRPPVNDGDMKNESPASGRISMSSDAWVRPRAASDVRPAFDLFFRTCSVFGNKRIFSLLCMRGDKRIGWIRTQTRNQCLQASRHMVMVSLIIFDHLESLEVRGVKVSLSENVLRWYIARGVIGLQLEVQIRHCSLPASKLDTFPLLLTLKPWSRSHSCTSEAYLQPISLLAFTRAGPEAS